MDQKKKKAPTQKARAHHFLFLRHILLEAEVDGIFNDVYADHTLDLSDFLARHGTEDLMQQIKRYDTALNQS